MCCGLTLIGDGMPGHFLSCSSQLTTSYFLCYIDGYSISSFSVTCKDAEIWQRHWQVVLIIRVIFIFEVVFIFGFIFIYEVKCFKTLTLGNVPFLQIRTLETNLQTYGHTTYERT